MLTLPYIYSISNLDNKNRKQFLLKIKRHISKKNISGIKNMIIESGGIKYAMDKIADFSDMAIKGEGGIINVASVAAFQPVPYMNVYSARLT